MTVAVQRFWRGTRNRWTATVTGRPPGTDAPAPRADAQLSRAFEDAQNDPECRCIVLTGSPEGRAFCSGDDVRKVMMAMNEKVSKNDE